MAVYTKLKPPEVLLDDKKGTSVVLVAATASVTGSSSPRSIEPAVGSVLGINSSFFESCYSLSASVYGKLTEV